MLARETRSHSFAQSSDNVMSELFRAIRKVRGAAANIETEDSDDKRDGLATHSQSTSSSPQGFSPVNDNSVTSTERKTQNVPSSSQLDLSNGNVVKGTSDNCVIPEPAGGVSIPPPPPPLPPPSSAGWRVTGTGTPNSLSPTKATNSVHVPSWTPNRPRRFVPDNNNTVNVFAELNSVLQKRFKKNDEKNEEGSDSVHQKTDSGNLKSPKKVTEKKSAQYSHMKQVSEKIVNGLNIVIVEQGDKAEKSGLANGSSFPQTDKTSESVGFAKTNTDRQFQKGDNQKSAKSRSTSAGVLEEIPSRTVKVSSLIESYQAGKKGVNGSTQHHVSKGNYEEKHQTSKPFGDESISVKTNKQQTSQNGNGSQGILGNNTNGGKPPVIHQNGIENGSGLVKVSSVNDSVPNSPVITGNTAQNGRNSKTGNNPQGNGVSVVKSPVLKQHGLSQNDVDSVKGSTKVNAVVKSIQDRNGKTMASSETADGKNSSEDDELVKAVVVHGSIGKQQQRRQPLSTMTEAAIASIILDKAIESDSESEVFFEAASNDKPIAVSDTEIDRYKAEIFGEDSVDKEGQKDAEYEKEMKEIKDVLTSASAPTSLRGQKISRTSIVNKEKMSNKTEPLSLETNEVYDNELEINAGESHRELKKENIADVTAGLKTNVSPEKGDSAISAEEANSSKTSPKVVSNLDDFRSPRRRRFSNISSETSSLDSTHNSSAEFVVVADVHVSSDDDKVLESPERNVSSSLSNDIPGQSPSGNGKVLSEVSYPSDFHTEPKPFTVQDKDNVSLQYPVTNLNHTETFVDDPDAPSKDVNDLLDNGNKNKTLASSETRLQDQNDNEQENSEAGDVKIGANHNIGVPLASVSVQRMESSLYDANAAINNTRVSSGSSDVAMDTESEGSLTSSLANYDIPDPSAFPENFGKLPATGISPDSPLDQSSPSLNALRGSNSSHGTADFQNSDDKASQEMSSPTASAIDFSEEELEIHISDKDSAHDISVPADRKSFVDDRHSTATHSPSASLTDTEVRNLTRKIDLQQQLLSADSGLGFKSLRSSSGREEPAEGHFRPVVVEKSQYSSQSERSSSQVQLDPNKKLPTKTPSPNFRAPASVIRYDSPSGNSITVCGASHPSSPEPSADEVREVIRDSPESRSLVKIDDDSEKTGDLNSAIDSSEVIRVAAEDESNKIDSTAEATKVVIGHKSHGAGWESSVKNDASNGSSTVINHGSVADTDDGRITVINHSISADGGTKDAVTVINHIPREHDTFNDHTQTAIPPLSPPAMKHHIPVNISHETSRDFNPNASNNNNSSKETVSVLHYGPPHGVPTHNVPVSPVNISPETSRDFNTTTTSTNNNSSKETVSVLHYGPPHGARPHNIPVSPTHQPTVIRYVPVTHHTTGYPRHHHHSNTRHHHHRHNHHAPHHHPGHRHHVTAEPYGREHKQLHHGPPRGKATTLFYDFNRRIAVPPWPSSGNSQQSYYTLGNHGYRRVPQEHSAVTVMHIAPTRGHHQTPNNNHNLSAYVKETRPKVAGYGPDILETNRNGNYSSHDTLTSLPYTLTDHHVVPAANDAVFTRQGGVQRKPSYTVMTSSSSSFTDSLGMSGQDRVYIDLRKPRHRKHRSRSPDKHRIHGNNSESLKSETDSSFNRTAEMTSETISTDISNITHNPPVRLVNVDTSTEETENTFEQGVKRTEQLLMEGGVKIVLNSESKVIIGSAESSTEGSPFIVDIDEGRMPTANGDGLYRGEEDRPATFYVDARGLRGELGVQVEGPNSIAKCNIEPERDGVYAVTYVPVEVGKYRAIVKWNNKEIPGSPFHPKVVDARKVKVVGGWQHFMDANDRVHLLVDEEKRIPFDVSEAGPGVLTAEVRGPGGKIPCHVEESGYRRTVCFTPREEGDHHIYAYWSDHTLVNAPFHGYAVGRRRSPDPTKVILSGRGLKEAVVHREAEFQIDGSEAGPGRPEVTLTGLKRNISVRVSSLGGGRYRCTYMPETAGAYLLHINWNDRQLRGSPFKVNVINAHYPQKVVVSGEGLKGGVMGRDINVIIDTRKAGPGELTAHCMGPHLVAYCELEDMRDGTYKLNIRPQEPGRHILQIKYGGEHVLGSPYVLRVGAQPDASKVRVSGPGVEHGILAHFESRFIVETRGAGAGQLTVRIRGPKGAFQVEMLRDSQKDRTILCRFDPTETGLYQIFVKWSGVDVPGSPFQVYIVDSQQELMRVMQGQIPAHYQGSTLNRSVYNSEYSSWRDDDYNRM